MAKSIFTFPFRVWNEDDSTKMTTAAVLVEQLPALVRLERDFGIKCEPTGMEDDSFGMAYIRKYVSDERIKSVADWRKYLTWAKNAGVMYN